MELPRNRAACEAGLQFASRYPGDPRHVAVWDFLPDEQLRRVVNLHDFAGMLVFDKWTCNTNGRQTLFVRRREGIVRARGGPCHGAVWCGVRRFLRRFCFCSCFSCCCGAETEEESP